MSVSEISGIRDGAYVMKDIFGFRQTGVGPDGVARGKFYSTGYQPVFLERIRAAGIELPAELFQASEQEVV